MVVVSRERGERKETMRPLIVRSFVVVVVLLYGQSKAWAK